MQNNQQQEELNVSKKLFDNLEKNFAFQSMESTAKEVKQYVKDSRDGKRIVFPTKFERLNKQLMGGFQPGKMYVISGRPGSSKSQLSNQILFDTLDVAKDMNRKVAVLYWSFEMPGYQQMLRIASGDCGKSVWDIISNESSVEFNEFNDIISKYAEYNIAFKNVPETITFVQNAITHFVNENPDYTLINLFDHTRLFKGGNANEIQRLADVANMMMEMQAKHQCISIVLSQLNKNIESPDRAKEQYQPQLTDLFGSDSLGQNTHVCMMLNRPNDMYGITEEYCGENPKGLLAVHITKNREGELGMIPYDTHYPSFKITER